MSSLERASETYIASLESIKSKKYDQLQTAKATTSVKKKEYLEALDYEERVKDEFNKVCRVQDLVQSETKD